MGAELINKADQPVSDERKRLVAAFAELHYQSLYTLAFWHTGGHEDALDLVQEAFLSLTKTTSVLPTNFEELRMFMNRVLQNKNKDRIKYAATRRCNSYSTIPLVPEMNLSDVAPSIEDIVILEDEISRINTENPIVVRSALGYSSIEIAPLTQYSPTRVRDKISEYRRNHRKNSTT